MEAINMTVQEITKEALENAYKAQIMKLFEIFVDALSLAKGDEEETQIIMTRFKRGLKIVKEAFNKTSEIVRFE